MMNANENSAILFIVDIFWETISFQDTTSQLSLAFIQEIRWKNLFGFIKLNFNFLQSYQTALSIWQKLFFLQFITF